MEWQANIETTKCETAGQASDAEEKAFSDESRATDAGSAALPFTTVRRQSAVCMFVPRLRLQQCVPGSVRR